MLMFEYLLLLLFYITTPGWYEEVQYEMRMSESSCCRTESAIHIWNFSIGHLKEQMEFQHAADVSVS